jgi:rod shape-determining protein MreB
VRNVVKKKIIAVGDAAAEHNLVSGEELITPIKNGVMVDYQATVALLEHVLSSVLSWWNIFQPKVVLAESLSLNQAISQAFGQAVQAAGGGMVYMAPVPTLAALGAGVAPHDSSGSFILDIGHGTTEAAVITRGSAVSSQHISFGGKDIIAAVSRYIQEEYDATVDMIVAEKILHTVGTALGHDNEKTHTFYANAVDTGEACSLQVSSNQIAEAINKPLAEVTSLVAALVKETPPTLLSDIAEKGVIITGGVGNLPDIATYLTREISIPVHVASPSHQAVIRGGREALKFLSDYSRLIPQNE